MSHTILEKKKIDNQKYKSLEIKNVLHFLLKNSMESQFLIFEGN